MKNQVRLAAAQELDKKDPLSRFRDSFVFPDTQAANGALYFAGHSLGLMPKGAKETIGEVLDAWGKYGVEGHFKGEHPWLPYHEEVTASLARLVGARAEEVVAMNSLTVNLHLMLVSFYRPTAKRFKILIENNTFPSDKYAVDSQAHFHGFDPKLAVVELRPRAGEITVRGEDILAQIRELGDELALVMLGNCNYLSGQRFDMKAISEMAHEVGAKVGFNLAHGAGNLRLKLHEDGPDFAVWCSYKYLNSGAGGIAGAFVHERNLKADDIKRFAGWWGHNKATRFKMGPQFDPLPSVEAWQLSNPPIFQLAALRASLALFDAAGIEALRERGDRLTAYFAGLLVERLGDKVQILTPVENRGSMLCLRFKSNPKDWMHTLEEKGVYVDFREPDIIRATPAPLYNSHVDICRLVEAFSEVIK